MTMQITNHPAESQNIVAMLTDRTQESQVTRWLSRLREEKGIYTATNGDSGVLDSSVADESLRMMETLIANLPGMAYRCRTADFGFDYISAGVRELTGYPADFFEPSGNLSFLSLIDSEDRALSDAVIVAALQNNLPYTVTYRLTDAQGRTRILWDRGRGVGVDPLTGGFIAVEGFVTDITDREEAQNALRASEERYRWLADSIDDVVALHEIDGKVLYVSPSVFQLTGYLPEEIVGSNTLLRVHPDDAKKTKRTVHTAFAAGLKNCITQQRYIRKDGAYIRTESNMRLLRDALGRPSQVLSSSRDVTKWHETEERLRWLAFHDTLTGLPNRALLSEQLESLLGARAESRETMALFFLDMDRFKEVNDTLGHTAGDELLRETARRLVKISRETDTVARLGGDEFVILLPAVKTEDEARIIARMVLDALRAPFLLDGHEISLSASIGITFFPRDGADLHALLKSGDLALYRSKARRRGEFQFYEPQMSVQVLSKMALETSLRQALERNEMRLLYQPQYDLRLGRIVAVEALLRWQHPQHGLLAPAEFLQAAEDSGMLAPIGEWILQEACGQAVLWQRNLLPDLRLAVNMSHSQCGQENLCDQLRQILDTCRFDSALLDVEIRESVIAHGDERCQSNLAEIRSMGIRIVVDDFGMGNTALAEMRQNPPHRLKIDRILIAPLENDETDRALLRSLVALGDALGVETVAEGVENARQADFLQTAGCHLMQGHYFSKPVTADQIESLLRNPHLPAIP